MGKGEVLGWFQLGNQNISGSERVRSGKDLRLIFPQKWGRRKGKDWALRKEFKNSICASEVFLFFFSDGRTHFSVSIWKEELPRVWGHLLTHSGIKLHEIRVKMDGVKVSYLYMVASFHWRCLQPLEGSVQAGWGGTGSEGDLCPPVVAAEA